MERPANPTDLTPEQKELAECVIAFASAVKNLTIYPASHPRVAQRAEEVAQKFNGCRRKRCELTLRGEQLVVDGHPLASDNLAVLWLVRRCREAGLRGVSVERGCSAEDVVRFAGELVACRPGAGRNLASTWSHDTARVLPLELVVEENHAVGSKRQVGDIVPAAGSTPALKSLGEGYAELLTEIADRPQVRELLRQIEGSSSSDTNSDPAGSLDVLGMIGELLPADIPRDPDELAATVEHILSRVHCELGELLRLQTQVKGADLLRSAVGVARKYFSRETPPVTKRQRLPTGRPGDEQYGADLDALLTEFEGLPGGSKLKLPSAADCTADSKPMARELLGVYLFGLAADESETHRRPRIALITELVNEHKADVTDLLDTYLSSSAGKAKLPVGVRVKLLGSLAKGGLATLLRARGFLDEDLITSGFPEILPIAPLLFVRDDDLPILRRALQALAPVLDNGGAEAAAKAGYLNSPETIELLTKIGGQQALALLSQVDSDDPDAHECLCKFIAGMDLPPAEAAVMTHYRQDDIPPSYVRRVLRALSRARFDHALRHATGELIRDYLTRRRARLPAAAGLALVHALQFAPSTETADLLRRLSHAGRFINFTRSARLLRQQARACLTAITKSLHQ